jgi:hypothetical protein
LVPAGNAQQIIMDKKGNMDEKGTRSGDAEMIGADAHETERTCGFHHDGKNIDNVNVASSKSMVVVEDTALPLATRLDQDEPWCQHPSWQCT